MAGYVRTTPSRDDPTGAAALTDRENSSRSVDAPTSARTEDTVTTLYRLWSPVAL